MSLDPAAVPEPLRYLIPLAERWGIGDDVERSQSVHAASEEDRDSLIREVGNAPELLWTWLVDESNPPHQRPIGAGEVLLVRTNWWGMAG